MEKSPDRLKVLEKIKEYEKTEKWDMDVEDDSKAPILMPNDVDYLNKKLSNKIKTAFANFLGTRFFEKMIKNKDLVIKNVVGIENFLNVQGSAFITCNHISISDNYAVYRTIKPYLKGKKLYKVIREGNYTSKSPFQFVFKHCNTLPLSSNMETMKDFMRAVEILLKNNNKILIYPEQAMWWNYKKPRPLKNGAFKLAVNNNVPIIPFFITMQDSSKFGEDGFPVQEYTINILPAIYPDKNLSKSENIKYMLNSNYNAWLNCYENFYGKKLEYDK